MNDRSEKFRNLLVPVLSVVLGLILGAILMAAFGFQPIQGYSSMLDAALGSQRGIGETLSLYWLFSFRMPQDNLQAGLPEGPRKISALYIFAY